MGVGRWGGAGRWLLGGGRGRLGFSGIRKIVWRVDGSRRGMIVSSVREGAVAISNTVYAW